MPKPDRIDRNKSDGQIFHGYDDKEEGTTTWYTPDGSVDSITKTPYDNSED